jgi:hypothetical protein
MFHFSVESETCKNNLLTFDYLYLKINEHLKLYKFQILNSMLENI